MDLVQPQMMKRIVDEGVLGISSGGVGNMNLILSTGIRMVLLVLLGGISGVLSGVFANLCSQNVANDLRQDCFRNICSLSFEQTDYFSTGSLITRVTNDVTQVQQLVSMSIRGFVRTFLLFGGGIYCMLQLDLQFGVVVACALPVVLGMILIFMHKVNPLFGQLQRRLDHLNTVMQENVSGARVVKAYVKEEHEKKRFGEANESLVSMQLRILNTISYMSPLINSILGISIIAVIQIGAIQVRSGIVTPGVVMAAITYITQILNAVMRMIMIFQTVSRGNTSAKRLMEVINCTPAIQDGNAESAPTVNGEVIFQNVSFAYPNGSGEQILKDISVTIHPGETFAILGATGCGKSTFVNLIPRFYDVTQGKVLVDGINVKDYTLHELRDKIAITLQKSELFTTTIGENIGWGKEGATQEDIEEAARLAQAEEFILRKEDGFDTQVAERGMSLSGGQKQRVAVSRAMLKQAEILILDDATSALDLKTEARLYEGLQRAYPNITKIIVAQRIASVKKADRIAIIEEGRMIACGTHEQLSESCKVYRDICASQNR